MSRSSYDFIVVGAGAAGLQLVLSILEEEFFSESTILIIDKSPKKENDRTWSFWEKGMGPYDSIIHKSWSKGLFHSSKRSIDLNMGEYLYKTLRAVDFYQYAKGIIGEHDRVDWLQSEVELAGSDGTVIASGKEYKGNWIFDSRIPEEYHTDTDSVKLLQHFLGWVIEFEDKVFDTDTFTMMDFRDRMPGTCSFMYILPFGPRKGLVEFTFFNETLIKKEEYEEYLTRYLSKYYPGRNYRIIEKEVGIIPMTTYKFNRHHDGKLIKIGTAGGWVKPSSGYSFKISQRFISRVIDNLKRGKSPQKGVAKGKNRFYDSIFLGILEDQNDKGEELFDNMYSKLHADLIFKFLDEETSVAEDIRIMSKYANATFTRAFFRQLFS